MNMKLLKKIGAVLGVMILLISDLKNVSAATVSSEAVYDLEKGGTQTFIIQQNDGDIATIIIEEVHGISRIANGNYKVTYDHTGVWKAGFYVEISNNKIIDAYSPFHSVMTGTITNATLTRNSNIKATYSFKHDSLGILIYNTGVVATISGTNLIVSRK